MQPVRPVAFTIRPLCAGDESSARRVLAEAAFSNIWPGCVVTVNTTAFKYIAVTTAITVFACTGSACCYISAILLMFLGVWIWNVAATLYYIYGPPLHDMRNVHKSYFSADNTHFWVAVAKGNSGNSHTCVVGTIAIDSKSNTDGSVARLRRMAVAKSHRRMGIASELVRTAVEFCQRSGYQKIELITTDIHQVARRLYTKLGFHCVNYRPYKYLNGLVRIWTYEFEYCIT